MLRSFFSSYPHQATLDFIKKREEENSRRPGLQQFRQGSSFVKIEDIPGVLEAGWRPDGAGKTLGWWGPLRDDLTRPSCA